MKKWITLCAAFLMGVSSLLAQKSNLEELTQNRKDIIVKINKRFLGTYSVRINLGDQLDASSERYNYDNRLKDTERNVMEFGSADAAEKYLNNHGYYFNPNKGIYWDHPDGAKNNDLRRNGTAKIGNRNEEDAVKKDFAEKMIFTNASGKIASKSKKVYKYPFNSKSLATVYFDTNSSKVRKQELKAIVDALKKDPKLRVRLEGNADKRGTSELNMALAKSRVNACLNELVTTYGFNKNRFETSVKGEDNPVSDQLHLNRRVDFVKIK